MEILGSRRACSEFGVRRSLFAGSQFAVRRFSELRIPNSEPRTLLFAGWPDTGVRRSQVRYSQFAVRGVAEYRSSPFAVRRFAGSPNSEYRTPNTELCCSQGGRIPEFDGSPVHRTPNTELRTFRLPPYGLRRSPVRNSLFAGCSSGFRTLLACPNTELRTPNLPLPPSAPFQGSYRLSNEAKRGSARTFSRNDVERKSSKWL